MFGCLIIVQLCVFPSNAIFSKPKHNESQYTDKQYSTPSENSFNLTQNETFIEKLQLVHKLAHSLVDTFNNRSVERFSSTQLEEIETNMHTLHSKIDELKVDIKREGLQLSSNSTNQLYLDTMHAIIKYNDIVTKLL